MYTGHIITEEVGKSVGEGQSSSGFEAGHEKLISPGVGKTAARDSQPCGGDVGSSLGCRAVVKSAEWWPFYH